MCGIKLIFRFVTFFTEFRQTYTKIYYCCFVDRIIIDLLRHKLKLFLYFGQDYYLFIDKFL